MLKRSIARFIIEIGHGNIERASVRMKYINGVLLPGCYRCVTLWIVLQHHTED